MEFRDLLVILGSFQSVFNFFVHHRLLASYRQCSQCSSDMKLAETTRVNDGYMWRCTNKRCRTWMSIRSGSFFEESNIPLSNWLHVMYLWAIQLTGSKISRLTGHTNTMEGLWALVKRKLKSMCGTLYEHVPSYLDEFTWFRNLAGDRAFEQL